MLPLWGRRPANRSMKTLSKLIEDSHATTSSTLSSSNLRVAISSERINGSLAYLRGSLFLIGCMHAFQLFDWSLVCEVCECVI